MWSLVILAVVSCVRAEAEADPGYVYLSGDWAAEQFGTPAEVASDSLPRVQPLGSASYAVSAVPVMPPYASFVAIRDVQAPPPSVTALRRPATLSFHHPFLLTPQAPPPFFLQALYLRVPQFQDDDDEDVVFRPIPIAAPALAFASQHTAQAPITRPLSHQPFAYPFPAAAPFPSFASQHTAQAPITGPLSHQPITFPIPAAAPIPSFASHHTAQVPVYPPTVSVAATAEDSNEDEEVRVVFARFPTQLAPILSFRGVGDEPVIPAGIAQSTQPSFIPFTFRNVFAHPTLQNKIPSTDGSVIEA